MQSKLKDSLFFIAFVWAQRYNNFRNYKKLLYICIENI